MYRLGLNQVLLPTCMTRGKSHKSGPSSLFVKCMRFHVPKLIGVRSVGAAFGGFSVAPLLCARWGRVSWFSASKPGTSLGQLSYLHIDKAHWPSDFSVVTQNYAHKIASDCRRWSLWAISRGLRRTASPRGQLHKVATFSKLRGGLPSTGRFRPRTGSIVKRLWDRRHPEANTLSVTSANSFSPLGLSKCQSIIFPVFIGSASIILLNLLIICFFSPEHLYVI